MIRWRAKQITTVLGRGGKSYPIASGAVVLTHTEPDGKDAVTFVPENNRRLLLILPRDHFISVFEKSQPVETASKR